MYLNSIFRSQHLYIVFAGMIAVALICSAVELQWLESALRQSGPREITKADLLREFAIVAALRTWGIALFFKLGFDRKQCIVLHRKMFLLWPLMACGFIIEVAKAFYIATLEDILISPAAMYIFTFAIGFFVTIVFLVCDSGRLRVFRIMLIPVSISLHIIMFFSINHNIFLDSALQLLYLLTSLAWMLSSLVVVSCRIGFWLRRLENLNF